MPIKLAVVVLSALLIATFTLSAQQATTQGTTAGGAAAQAGGAQAAGLESLTDFDQAAVERGRELLGAQCGFCHGSNARGGQGGPDLTRSSIVQDDEDGRQLGSFLRTGRPDRGMPQFDLADGQLSDLAAFLHATIYLAANRRLYQILDIVVGDPKAGEAFFNGAGNCHSCHSAAGDLKGIGGRLDPATLQNRLVMPRGGRGALPPGAVPPPPYLDKNAVKITVTLPSGQSSTGALVRVTDFDVTLYDPGTEQLRSWLRNGDVPRLTVVDPLQAHVDMWVKWTDTDMHNMTAYLVGLK
jgi:cytochrome c oxidase cbb3-type subunit III